jgi:hypothetical protein
MTADRDPIPVCDVIETWRGIAAAVNRSERWARYMAARTDNPLPVWKVGGIVRVHRAELAAWLKSMERALGAKAG